MKTKDKHKEIIIKINIELSRFAKGIKMQIAK